MNEYQVRPIGTIQNGKDGIFIKLFPEYVPGLEALDGFSHINVLWWFSNCDNPADRCIFQAEQPYKNAPAVMGVFATRSPLRPNPIALTASEIIKIDADQGVIQLDYIDADNGTPVLDIKPYTPSLDRVETPGSLSGAAAGPIALRPPPTSPGTRCSILRLYEAPGLLG